MTVDAGGRTILLSERMDWLEGECRLKPYHDPSANEFNFHCHNPFGQDSYGSITTCKEAEKKKKAQYTTF